MTLLENALIALVDLDNLISQENKKDDWDIKASKLIHNIYLDLQDVRKVYEADRDQALMEGFERAAKVAEEVFTNKHIN